MPDGANSLSHSLATLPALLASVESPALASGSSGGGSSKQGKAVVLSSALPPITARLAAKILSGQFAAMKELLADNMMLCHHLEPFPSHQHLFAGAAKPRLREIDSPLTWVLCFLAYAAVRTSDTQTRSLLTYGRLVVREAQRYNGPGWLEYDRIFQQHAALSPSTVWHELNPSLHASTVLSYRAGPGKVCNLCHEPDHAVDVCAMQVLQPQLTPAAVQQSLPPHSELGGGQGVTLMAGGSPCRSVRQELLERRPVHQETLERICVSWNKGRCSFPSCGFRHICATCKQRGHRARECLQTPESLYKVSTIGSRTGGSGGSGPQA